MIEEIDKAAEQPIVTKLLKAFFVDFTASELETLGRYLEIKRYQAGSIVWNQGDHADFMGFLVRGKMVVKKQTSFPGKYILLAVLENGSIFGERSVVAPLDRSVTVIADEVSDTMLLSHANAQKIFLQEPALGVKLLKKILAITGSRLQGSGARLAELL